MVYTVQDNGPGVPDDLQQRILEPFYTTKQPGYGIGLGLSICHGIVKEHGGDIRYETALGGGGRFIVELPATREPSPEYAPAQREPTRELNDEAVARILVVDDEPLVREIVRRVLVGLGHEVTVVSSGAEALAQLERGGSDVTFVDLKMPGESGVDVCSAIRQTQPDVAVIAMSGFISDEDAERLRQLGVVKIMAKPVSIKSLGSAVREAVDWRDR